MTAITRARMAMDLVFIEPPYPMVGAGDSPSCGGGMVAHLGR